jgi:hypothetical protein
VRGRYVSFLPAECLARLFATVNPLPSLAPATSRRPKTRQSSAVTRRRAIVTSIY